ncbi:MAG: hypothetical protein VW268_06990 [Rhodospirillaceae bacterium]
MFRNTKISKKLSLLIIQTGLLGVGIASVAMETIAEKGLEEAAERRLVAIAESREVALGGFLSSLVEDLHAVSSNPCTLRALNAFIAGWDAVEGDKRDVLQKRYIIDNPHPTGEKDKLLTIDGDTSAYGQAHTESHPWFHNFLKGRGYYDIFLFDMKGTLVCTVFKEL